MYILSMVVHMSHACDPPPYWNADVVDIAN